MVKGFQGRERDRFPKAPPNKDDLAKSKAALEMSGQLNGDPDKDAEAILNFAQILAGMRTKNNRGID